MWFEDSCGHLSLNIHIFKISIKLLGEKRNKPLHLSTDNNDGYIKLYSLQKKNVQRKKTWFLDHPCQVERLSGAGFTTQNGEHSWRTVHLTHWSRICACCGFPPTEPIMKAQELLLLAAWNFVATEQRFYLHYKRCTMNVRRKTLLWNKDVLE